MISCQPVVIYQWKNVRLLETTFKKEQWDYSKVKTFFQFNDIQKKKSLTGENKKLVCITGSLCYFFSALVMLQYKAGSWHFKSIGKFLKWPLALFSALSCKSWAKHKNSFEEKYLPKKKPKERLAKKLTSQLNTRFSSYYLWIR